jgi:hypothetical protein
MNRSKMFNEIKLTYFGDGAYPLKMFVLKPYTELSKRGKNLAADCCAQDVCIECAFEFLLQSGGP